jgi:exo-1,4-beta-D-glucosaminidase
VEVRTVAYRSIVASVCVSCFLAHGCHDSRLTPAEPHDAGGADASVTEPDAARPAPEAPPCAATRMALEDFQIQRASELNEGGDELSQASYAGSSGWHRARVPTTVLAALVDDGTYADPRVGDNLLDIPEQPFEGPWWYRSTFRVEPSFLGTSVRLHLSGVNYRADVWLNGQKIASQTDLVGTYVPHDLEVSAELVAGTNALAIQVFPPDPDDDLTISFNDWNPNPPDQGMGLWREVYLERTGAVALEAAQVETRVHTDADTATLRLRVTAINRTGSPVSTTLHATLLGHTLSQEIELTAHEARTVWFEPEEHPELVVESPALWWPARMGKQPLHELCIGADAGGEASDQAPLRFGMREVSSDLDEEGHRRFRINGKPLFVRGGGYAMDMLLKPPSDARIDAELGYALDLGLNTIRLEGKLESDAFFARTDELGLLTIPGWMCCDMWEAWSEWSDEDRKVAMASTAGEAARLGTHPSVLAFMISSDHAPPDDVAAEYRSTLEEASWPGAILPSASAEDATDLPSGVKMTGPYDWVAPSYWYLDEDRGGAHGFNTEAGPGPAIPELESLSAMLNKGELERLWREPNEPQLHAGGGDFDTLELFAEALSARFGKPVSLEDFVEKAQLMNYEAERAPYEAYARHKHREATGFVHWMLNNAWPSLIWHLYGHDLSLGAGYFGVKKANEPLHVQYSYDDGSVWVVNDTRSEQEDLTVKVRVYNLDGTQAFEQNGSLSMTADASVQALNLPELGDVSETYFLALELEQAGKAVSHNLYWLSTRPEVVDFEDSDYRHTGTAQFFDFTALSELPQTKLEASATKTAQGEEDETHVTLKNVGKSVAFFVRLTVKAGAEGKAVWPVLWTDNYVSLLPGEERELTVRYGRERLDGRAPVLEVQGFNVARAEVTP